MIAIISRATEQGRVAEVGTSNRTIARLKTKRGIRKRAYQYAAGKECRIEYFTSDKKFYGNPESVEYLNSPLAGGALWTGNY